jgi:hypothetical protein
MLVTLTLNTAALTCKTGRTPHPGSAGRSPALSDECSPAARQRLHGRGVGGGDRGHGCFRTGGFPFERRSLVAGAGSESAACPPRHGSTASGGRTAASRNRPCGAAPDGEWQASTKAAGTGSGSNATAPDHRRGHWRTWRSPSARCGRARPGVPRVRSTGRAAPLLVSSASRRRRRGAKAVRSCSTRKAASRFRNCPGFPVPTG